MHLPLQNRALLDNRCTVVGPQLSSNYVKEAVLGGNSTPVKLSSCPTFSKPRLQKTALSVPKWSNAKQGNCPFAGSCHTQVKLSYLPTYLCTYLLNLSVHLLVKLFIHLRFNWSIYLLVNWSIHLLFNRSIHSIVNYVLSIHLLANLSIIHLLTHLLAHGQLSYVFTYLLIL